MVENELLFLRWDAFRVMTPTILRLEVDRLGALIDGAMDTPEFRNVLVKARYEVMRFVAGIQDARDKAEAARCAPYLQTALLAVSLAPAPPNDATRHTLAYVRDRLAYINDRIPLIV